MDRPVSQRSRRLRGRETDEQNAGSGPAPASFPWRGFFVGLAGVVVACVVTPYSSLYLNSSQLGVDYLPITAFSFFLMLVGLNAVLRILHAELSRADLFLAYVMMLVTAAVPTSGYMSRLLPALMAQFYHASEQNNWAHFFWRYVPDWAGPRDWEVIRTFYEGAEDGAVPWGHWIVPLGAWLVPFASIGMMILALGILFRRQWVERERLIFPLAQVPLTLIDDEEPRLRASVVRNWVFWVAFAVPFFINFLNGIHRYYPAAPHIAAMDPYLQRSIGSFLDDPNWRLLYKDLYFELHFALVGVAMLTRQEVSLSFWSFQAILGVLLLVFQVVGIGQGLHVYTPNETFGYIMFTRYTRFGAAIVIVCVCLWGVRTTLLRAFRLAFRPRRAVDDEDRMLRWPFWLLAAGSAMYVVWTLRFGMSLASTMATLVIGLIVFIVMARVIAEGGLIWCSISIDSIVVWPTLVGTTALNSHTVTAMAYTSFIPFAARANMLPSVMDGLKISHSTGLRPRHVLIALAVALPLAFVVSAVVVLKMSYGHGGNYMPRDIYEWGPEWLFDRAKLYFTQRVGPSWPALGTTVVGVAIMALLYRMHRRHVWWPFYPLGFVTANSAVMVHQWFSIFVGWLVRTVVVRVAGGAGYRSMLPAALGVIVGDLSGVFLWFIVDALTGTTGRTMTHHTSTW